MPAASYETYALQWRRQRGLKQKFKQKKLIPELPITIAILVLMLVKFKVRCTTIEMWTWPHNICRRYSYSAYPQRLLLTSLWHII